MRALRHPLALVVARPGAEAVDVAVVVLALGMHGGIAVDLGRRRLHHAGAGALGELEQIQDADRIGLDRQDRIALVVPRRRRTRQIIDLIDVELPRLHDVVVDKAKPAGVAQVRDVGEPAGQEIVDADDVVAARHEARAQVGADEPGPAGDQDAGHERWLRCGLDGREATRTIICRGVPR
jgi:hypothetical protein